MHFGVELGGRREGAQLWGCRFGEEKVEERESGGGGGHGHGHGGGWTAGGERVGGDGTRVKCESPARL